MASFERCAIDENGNLVKITIGGDTELVLTGSCVLATSTTAPPGTLIADGSEVSRQAYDKLFAAIGTDYGEGDGVTTFALPDWRDEFPRFSGVDRAVGTKQTDTIRNITGYIGAIYSAPSVAPQPSSDGALKWNIEGSLGAQLINTPSGKITKQDIILNASMLVPTSDENRPRNVAFLPCIVYL